MKEFQSVCFGSWSTQAEEQFDDWLWQFRSMLEAKADQMAESANINACRYGDTGSAPA